MNHRSYILPAVGAALCLCIPSRPSPTRPAPELVLRPTEVSIEPQLSPPPLDIQLPPLDEPTPREQRITIEVVGVVYFIPPRNELLREPLLVEHDPVPLEEIPHDSIPPTEPPPELPLEASNTAQRKVIETQLPSYTPPARDPVDLPPQEPPHAQELQTQADPEFPPPLPKSYSPQPVVVDSPHFSRIPIDIDIIAMSRPRKGERVSHCATLRKGEVWKSGAQRVTNTGTGTITVDAFSLVGEAVARQITITISDTTAEVVNLDGEKKIDILILPTNSTVTLDEVKSVIIEAKGTSALSLTHARNNTILLHDSSSLQGALEVMCNDVTISGAATVSALGPYNTIRR